MKEKMSLKLQAWQGLLVVIVILGIIGGTLQLAATEFQQNPDLTAWMGAYQAPVIAFLQNSWLIIVVTFIYNIFMYFRQTQLAKLKQTVELFQIEKFVATLTWFVGILGPMAALISDKQIQGIIALIITIVTALISELNNLKSNQTILPPTALGPPSASTPQTPTQSSTPTPGIDAPAPIITYGPWIQTVTVTPSAYGPAGTTIWTRDVYTNGSFSSQQVQTSKPTG